MSESLDLILELHSECAYCGRELAPDDAMDHVVPRSKGGTNHPANLVPACRSCNSSKCNKDLHEWLLYLQRHLYSAFADIPTWKSRTPICDATGESELCSLCLRALNVRHHLGLANMDEDWTNSDGMTIPCEFVTLGISA